MDIIERGTIIRDIRKIVGAMIVDAREELERVHTDEAVSEVETLEILCDKAQSVVKLLDGVCGMQIEGGIRMRCSECGYYPMDQKTVLGDGAKTTYTCPKCGHSFVVRR